ncbi:MAG: NADH:ubiquinone oxidoreductase subunit A [Chloroflexi bacterium RBG_16_50_11]|nr:MAG: NADH:ubiquinone oxidoreductase subunit A [Chloroflexi bacterium RBG_16_50_11]
MLANYGLIGLFFVVVLLFSLSMIVIPIVLRYLKIVPSNPNPVKNSIFECGMETIGKTWVQFNFRYYFYALVFLALDVIVIFLYPWAVQVRELGLFSLFGVLILVGIILIGYIYAWKKKALEWK